MEEENIRQSAIAGSWYPGERIELQNVVENYFKSVKKEKIPGRIMGLISPHAGYVYSGQTAAYSYNQIRGMDVENIVVIAPMHRIAVSRYMTNAEAYYKTPLGLVPVNHRILDEMRKHVNLTFVAGDDEHSLEIQLPFLQSAIKEFSIVPILIGHSDVYDINDITGALINVLDKEKTLIVASSDMHHIDDYRKVEENDNRFIQALESFDLVKIREVLNREDSTICGRVPISILLEVVKKWGAKKIHILNRTNSAEVTGRKIRGEYTVGYLAAAIVG